MEWGRQIHSENLKIQGAQKFATIVFVKYVMVKAAIIEVVERARLKFRKRTRSAIPFEIVQSEDFRQVRKVLFADVLFKIGEHGGDRGGSTAMVEGFAVVRQHED